MKNAVALVITLTVMFTFATGARADQSDGLSGDAVLTAMLDELDRSVAGLRLREGDYDLPYFVYYAVRDVRSSYVSGKNGAIFVSSENRSRMADVDIRVGSYDLDSSEDKEAGYNMNQKFSPTHMAPVDDSIPALRGVLWLLSDHSYKAALMSFHNVKAVMVNDPEERKSGSLSREEPVVLVEPVEDVVFDRSVREETIRRASAVFLQYPDIFDSSVESSSVSVVRYIVNSEGTRIRTSDTYHQTFIQAYVRAADGMLLHDSVVFYGRAIDDMPDAEAAVNAAHELARYLMELKSAPVLDPATVPVLMSPQATGVFFHETIGHRLEGQRQDDQDEGRTFKSYLDQEILPSFLSIYDDPSVARFNGQPLNGFYRVDDEGVRGVRAVLVKDGVLKGFMMSRKPIEGFARSNGHGRTEGLAQPQSRMSTFFIEGSSPLSHDKLFSRFLREIRKQKKPWGLYVDRMAGGNTNTSSYGYQAFKVMPTRIYRIDAATGSRELVRGVEIVGTPLLAIKRIIATSDRYDVFNGYCGAESGSVPVSTVAPEVIFSEMELQRTQDSNERPLILPPPFCEAAAGTDR